MHPYDSPEEAAFRAEARAWLEASAEPLADPPVLISSIVSEWSVEQEAAEMARAKEWQRTKYDAGWAGVDWPSDYGGRAGTLSEAAIFAEEESHFDVPFDALVVGVGWCGRAVMQHATPVLASEVLSPLLRGDEVWCQLFSEPGAGSDVAALATTARRDGDEWLLTGQKVWTTMAHLADWGLCIARHDAAQPKHRGLTAFLVDMRQSAVDSRPMRQMTDASNFNEVFLNDATVPDSHRVGEVGEGWRVAMTAFTFERYAPSFSNAAAVVHALRKVIEEAGVADDPRVRARFADIYARAEALRYTGMRLISSMARGQTPGAEGSTMKLLGTLLLGDIYELGLEALGAHGVLAGDDAPVGGEWHAGFLGAPGLRIGGGTDSVQRNIIGERVLGLPGDLRRDKDVAFKDAIR